MCSNITVGSKVTSVGSFTMVLEFFDIKHSQFRSLLRTLKPSGNFFYQEHVEDSLQFVIHSYDRSEEFILNYREPEQIFAWNPPISHLMP